MSNAVAASSGQSDSGIVGNVFGPIASLFGKLLQFLLVVLIIAIVILGCVLGWRYYQAKQQTGEVASIVTHTEVQASEPISGVKGFLKSNSPELYAAFYPGEYNPYAIDSEVEYNENNRDIGVKIQEFRPITDFFRPNSDIRFLGRITAKGLDQPLQIMAFCSLEEYQNNMLIPAELLGTGAVGNTGTIFKGQSTEFAVSCNFPGGISVTKQLTSKVATLTVVYQFETQAYQRVWFLDNQALVGMQSNGIDPFDQYSIADPLMDSNNKIRSKRTPGPVELGLQIDFPQPLTNNAKYLLMVQLCRAFDTGNLETLTSLSIQVPAVSDLNLILEGERSLGGTSTCDFEYSGDSGNGYKEYILSDLKLQETNQGCDPESLRKIALTEQDCISIFKEPLFTCNFVATSVPQTLSSDIITAKASYNFKVKKLAVADIKALPNELPGQTRI